MVTLLGARGTGKTRMSQALTDGWRSSGMTVVTVQAREVATAEDLMSRIAEPLRSHRDSLSLASLPEGSVVRYVIDGCEEWFGKGWLPSAQERLRALLSLEDARGRVGALLLARPLFRQIAGGAGSPLLNLGPVVTTAPLTPDEVEAEFGVSTELANAVHRKTGGHPHLTELLIAATDGSPESLGSELAPFVKEHERYLIRLVEDHTTAAAGVLRDLLEATRPVPQPVLVQRHFGGAYSEGHEVVSDLAASGLITCNDDRCAVGAELLKRSELLRQIVRTPAPHVPVDTPEEHLQGAKLVYEVENRLRKLVAEHLGRIDAMWWPVRIPQELATTAEGRRQAELGSPAAPRTELHPIMYLTLGELLDVVRTKENWNEVFRISLDLNTDAIDEITGIVTAVRHKVAHNRPVPMEDVQLLAGAASRLVPPVVRGSTR